MIPLSTELRYHTYCLFVFISSSVTSKDNSHNKSLVSCYLELQKDYFTFITQYSVESVNLNQHPSQKTLRVSNVNHPMQNRNYF